MPIDYERRPDDSIVTQLLVEGAGFVFHAKEIRRERTGVHATITLAYGPTILAFDTFNVGRSEDRGRLAKKAHTMLGSSPVAEAYPLNLLNHDLDIFCDGLWDAWTGRIVHTYTTGDDADSQPAFLMSPYIIAEAGTILFGPRESGKSWTAMMMCTAMEHGISGMWDVSEYGGRPLFVNLERSEASVRRRIRRVNMAMGLTETLGFQCIHARGASLQDVEDAIKVAIQDKGSGISCIFVDSISRAGLGDLNDNSTANRLIDVLNGFGIAWLGLAHTPRGDDTHMYGSIMQEAGADIIVRQTAERKDDATLLVALEMTKGSDVPRAPRQLWGYEFDLDYGLSNVRKARAIEFEELDADRKPSLKQEVISWLQDNGSKGTSTELAFALERPRESIARLFHSDPSFMRLPKEGKEQPYGPAAPNV